MPTLVMFQWHDLDPVWACDTNVRCQLDPTKGETDVYQADACISDKHKRVTCTKCLVIMDMARSNADPRIYRPALDVPALP
jgi:hypothetical protein